MATNQESCVFGVRSASAQLRRALLVAPAGGGDYLGAGWRPPDIDRLRAEHEAFAELLTSLGVDVIVAQAEHELVDACFAYDPVFVTGRGTIVFRMTKSARRAEPDWIVSLLEETGVPTIARLEEPAYADGGDMFWLDESTLAVGRGYRTNAAAHEQLKVILAREAASLERFDLPHHRGAAHFMHLLSVVSLISDDHAVVYEPQAPVTLL
jgi:dimethylargininase